MNKLVVYTDGSFYPIPGNPTDGFYGAGAHGYIYDTSTENTIPKSGNNPKNHVITQRGYILKEKHKPDDKRKPVTPSHYFDATYSYSNKGNNVIAELKAVISTLESIKTIEIPIEEILVITDSTYVIHCIDLIQIGNQERWDNEEYKNRDLIQLLKTTMESLNIPIKHSKVEGHTGNIGNTLADRLSVYARNKSISREIGSTFNLVPADNYWNTQAQRHPFLRYRQMFITNSIQAPDDRNIYSIMEYSSSTEPGRKSHDACFGLVTLKEHQDLIEQTIKSYQNFAYRIGNILGSLSPVYTLDLNNLFSRNNMYYYNLFGSQSFNFIPKSKQLQAFDGSPLIHNINPPGLALQALERMQSLYKILSDYESNTPSNNISYLDITKSIYDIKLSKSNQEIYNISLDTGQQHLTVDINLGKPIKLLLDLGKDTLSRNQLKALESQRPNIILVTEELPSSKKTIRMYNYYTIVTTEDGDIGIFCNFYSGKILVDLG